MKSKLLRILSLILVLASLLSMFSVFAYADGDVGGGVDGGQNGSAGGNPGAELTPLDKVLEVYPDFSLVYQRNFEEGWAVNNGMDWVDRGSFVGVNYEMTADYYYNYFMRFTVGSSEHSYLQLNFDDSNNLGTVLEFDIMSDDYCHLPNLLGFGTPGTVFATRECPDGLAVNEGKISFFGNQAVGNKLADGSTTAGLGDITEAEYDGKIVSDADLAAWTSISSQWLHIAFVFDYTWGDVVDPETLESYTPAPDPDFVFVENLHEKHQTGGGANGVPADRNPTNYKNYFTMSIYIAPTEEYEKTGELYLVDTRTIRGRTQSGGEGIDYVRIGASGNAKEQWDTSVCFDNIVAYTGANVYGLADPSMGSGSKVNENARKEYEVMGDGDTKSDSHYILEGVALKLGVDYMRVNRERVAIATDEKGNVLNAAPLKDRDGNVLIPLLPVLDAMNYKYYLHEDGNYVDIATGDSSSYISVGKNTATVDGERVTLSVAPGYHNGVIYIGAYDLNLLVPDKFVNYDDMGLIVIADKADLLDRETQLAVMLQIMKSFVFDYKTPDEIRDEVEENTDGFTHPYLLGKKDEFDRLRSIYNAEPGDENFDGTIKNYLQTLVNSADSAYNSYYAKPITTLITRTEFVLDGDGNKIPEVDEEGNPVFDEDGNPVYKTEEVPTTTWGAIYNDDGTNVTHYVFDENGEFYLDENGNVPFVQATDENGEPMFDDADEPYYVKAQYIAKTDGEGNPVLDEDGKQVYELDENYVESFVNDEGNTVYVRYQTIVTVDELTGERTPVYLYEERTKFAYTFDYSKYIGIFDDGYDFNRDGDAYELDDYFREIGRNYYNYSLSQPNLKDGAGYDTDGGRSNLDSRTTVLNSVAFGWQITRDVRYLLYAYDVAIAIGKLWEHWGPGHFLNCADGSSLFAYMFDMCYDGFVAIANDTGDLDGDGINDFDIQAVREYNALVGRDPSYYRVEDIANILYEKGVYEGYISSNDINTFYISPIVGNGGSLYRTRQNNWNAVCSSGMIICALAVLEFDDVHDFANKGKTVNGKAIEPEIVAGTISDHAAWLIANNIENLSTYGLDCYAPDGAYIEGPGYWNYGTNNFFELCFVLDSAAGHNYGLMDCWGIDTTCLYACQTESSDFRTFNYHDGAMSSQDSSFFFYAAEAFGNADLAMIRLAHIKGGKKITIFDLMAYPRGESSGEAQYPALDYYSVGIDLYSARSSWDKGALYVGIIGGANEHSHNQIDAGSFVYHNNGAVWFIDLGTENYNTKGFWAAATRYRYYVMKPEGNNTITVTTDIDNVPWGQQLSGVAKAYEYVTNEYGSYVKYEMTSTLAPAVNTWQRAVMLTNNRRTTIIQDEIASNGNQSYYWFGHYSLDYVRKVEISPDGRTAYMYGKESRTVDDRKALRVSIVSPQTDLKFVDMDTYTFVHNDPEKGTYHKDWVNAQGPDENDRSKYRKLAIEGGGIHGLAFNVAVVIELIEKDTIGTNREEAVEYNWSEIKDWQAPVESFSGSTTQEGLKRPAADRGDFAANVNRAKTMFENGVAYNTSFSSFYRSMTDAYYIYTLLEEQLQMGYASQIADYLVLRDSFQGFRGAVINISGGRDGITSKLMGW